jgi:uncharacterized protein
MVGTMKLTNVEKLMLTILTEIHKQLKIENGVDPEFIQEAIYSGNTWALRWKYPGIFDPEDTDESIVRETVNILDMWSRMERAYERLSAEDKKRVETEAEPFGRHVRFTGFDGNNESEYMGVATFLVEHLDRFTEFKGRGFNSHMPSLDIYRRMLTAYRSAVDLSGDGELTVTQLIEILKSKRYPDNR